MFDLLAHCLRALVALDLAPAADHAAPKNVVVVRPDGAVRGAEVPAPDGCLVERPDFAALGPIEACREPELESALVSEYPDEALERGVSGDVLATVLVDRNGRVVWVDHLDGDLRLQVAAREVVCRARFRPLVVGQEGPVAAIGTVVFRFVIEPATPAARSAAGRPTRG